MLFPWYRELSKAPAGKGESPWGPNLPLLAQTPGGIRHPIPAPFPPQQGSFLSHSVFLFCLLTP